MRNPYISMLVNAWKYAGNKRKIYVLVYVMFVLANMTLAFNPILYGWFVDHLQKEGTDALAYAWIYGLSFIGLRLLEWSFHGPARIMERNLAFDISKNFLAEHFHKVIHLPVQWHQDHHSGATINRLRKGYEAMREFFQNGFISLHAMGKFVFSFAAMIYFSPLFGSIAVLLGMFTIWVIFKFDKPYLKSLREINEREHDVSSSLFDNLSNIITVITLRLEKRIEGSLLSKVKRVFPSFRRNIVVNEWKWFTAQMLIALIYSVVIIGYVWQNWEPGKVIMIGGLVTLLGYITQFTSVFNDVAAQYTKILQYHTDVQAAQQYAAAFDEQHRPVGKILLPQDWKTVTIKDLNFHHAGDYSNGLKNISLDIHKGKKIALIGESGSGKSTLLALMRGLYLPSSKIEIDTDLQQGIPFAAVSNAVTLFPQDPEIFENSILYNITLGLPFTNEDVMKVCDTAQFSDVVGNLPRGLDTHIQEKGVNLSGGQKQRLALARGILAASTSDIVLMDEPTSSVDPRTEKHIYQKLFAAFKDKAVISSLHRLHLLCLFDYVYILDKGKIIDEGTFTHLLQNSEAFKEMWKHQEEVLIKN
ncbi:MAG: ABC transporter ATP-binding protein [Cytophagaceae bacterium]